MGRSWKSGTFGELILRASPWTLTLLGDVLAIEVAGSSTTLPVVRVETLSSTSGVVWSTISLRIAGKAPIELEGIGNGDARELVHALNAEKDRIQRAIRIEALLSSFDRLVAPIVTWSAGVLHAARTELKKRGWLRASFCQRCLDQKPQSELPTHLGEPEIIAHLASKPPDVQNAVRLWQRDFHSFATSINERHLASELIRSKPFLDRVEKTPLTEEQARAVICFDSRVQVIASAGSGKTSTMVAKAGYALHRKLVPADKILMLAFNADAAAELQKRIRNRLGPLGFPAEQVVARTFHAFGLDVIGQATGKRPTLAPWLDQSADLQKLAELVDALKDRDRLFRISWDLFRIVFARDLPRFGKEASDPEDWDRETKATGFRTLRGEIVKSRGERLIADWLFYNGVSYQYEPPYKVDTADARHRQYRPDFYYPEIETYHEHWALDASGRPPAEFPGYLEGVAWKRACHRTYGTELVETTMADLWSGQAFQHLEKELTRRGIRLDPNPEREVPGRPTMPDRELIRLVRTFLTHAKSNRLSNADLRSKISAEPSDRFTYRHKIFLSLFEKVREAWEEALRQEAAIDFEDMLNLATDHLEARRWINPFELVMVDEFQDASQARARMTRALLINPESTLFAVGDDWQSINRFAGADVSVMTKFQHWFGKAQILRLERTFRCPQALCDISSGFVQANPSQLRKKVQSETTSASPAVQIIQVQEDDEIIGAVRTQLDRIRDYESAAGDATRSTVLILGRYNQDRQYAPRGFPPQMEVAFMTVHGSKGLEADYVILPRVASGVYGFPSEIVDDPVLQFAMPQSEGYPHAEERRLFYVALTRARRGVVVIAVAGRPSSFVAELANSHAVTTTDSMGRATVAQHACPRCQNGFLFYRTGRFGPFLGCTRYPACLYTRDLRHQGQRSRRANGNS